MLFNKNTYRKTNDKKLLHKIGKRWVTVSIAMLALLGGGMVASSTTHASANVAPNSRAQTIAVKNSMNQRLQQKPQSNSGSVQNSQASGSNTNDIMNQAKAMHRNIVGNAPTNVSNSSTESSSNNSASGKSSSSSASKTKGLMLDAPAPSKPVSTNSNIVNSGSSSVSQPSSVSASSNSASGNDMTTLDLGNSSQQARGWNFVQHGIRNNDYDRKPINSPKASAVNNSASGNQTTPISSASAKSSIVSGSNSASKVPSNAPINAHKSSFNSTYDNYMSQMSSADSEVASMNKSNANSSSNTANKPLLKNDDNATTQPSDNHWIAEGTMTSDGLGLKTFTPNKYIDSMPATDDISDGTYYGLHFKYDKTLQALEFTSGTPRDPHNNNKNDIYEIFIDNMDTGNHSDIDNARSIKFDNAVDISKTTQLMDLGHESFPNTVIDVVFGTNFDTRNVAYMGDLFSDSLKSITITSPKTKLSYKNPPTGHFKHGYYMDGLGIPTMYKVLPEKDASGQNYTLSTPNDFSKGNVGTFVSTPNPKPILYQIDFDDVSNDNSVGTQSITAQKGAIYNVVSDATAKRNGNSKNDIIIPNGYQTTNNTPKTITISQGKTSYISVAPVHQNTNTNSADIPVQGHQITFKGNIVLHFQSNSNHDIKDIYIPYNVTTKVDENIQNLLSKGNPTAIVPTNYLNKVIQKFNTSNYSYAHQVNGKSDNGTYYNNVWISPNMAGANDTDAKDKVTGTYNSANDTYTNPDFQLDFNALDPGDKPSDTNSPSNSNNSDSPLNPNNKRHGDATKPTAKGQTPNPWNPQHSDSPFNPSNTNSPYDPTSPLNPDNPSSPLNPKNDNGNTNPNNPNSQYNPNNPNSILNPKNDNSPLNPSKPDSPLNQKNNPYQPNDTKNNPWNPNTSDSPLNPNNPNSPLNTKDTANPANTTNPNNPNNPLTPSNEKKRGDNNKPSGNNTNDPSDVPTKPSNNGKPSDSDVNTNDKTNPNHNPSVPSHVQNPNKPIDNNKTTKGGQSNPNYNPALPDKTSDTKNGTNTTPNQPDDNKDASGKSTDIPDNHDDANNTFYVTINDFNNNHLVRSYQKRVLENNIGTTFTLKPSDYTTEGYSMDSADKSYTGYVSANGLTTIDKSTPQSSIVWNYNANSHTVPVHYINQKGKDLTPNATITGNTSDVITPSDKLPAGYHVNPSDKPYKFGSNASDITFNVSGNQLKDSAKATIHLVFDHDGQKYSSRNVTVSLKGKHIGDSDVIVYPFQYQPTNDTYHEVPFPENPADIKLNASNFDNSGNYTPSNTFTYDATTAPSLVVRYVNVDPNAQSVGKGNDSKGCPIIESDTYSANQLESAPYNLDWVVGNKFTFGVTGSTNKNTVNLIKAPAGYDLDDNAQGFNYQNGIETMTLTNGFTYKGHPAMLLMVGLGAMPIHHHVQPKPNKHTNKPSSASVKPSSASVAPSSKASSASSSVAPSNVSPDIVMPSSNTNSVSSALTSTESSFNIASSVSSASQSNSKASVGSSAVSKIKSVSSAKPVVHKISKKSVSAKHIESAKPKAHVNKINKINHRAVSEASNMPTKAVQANSTNSVESGHQVATFKVHEANNNVPYVVASESEPTNVSANNVESAPVNNASNDEAVLTNSAVAKGTVVSHNINNTNTNNAHKLPQTNEASSHSVLVAIVALLAGLSLIGVDLYRKHNN